MSTRKGRKNVTEEVRFAVISLAEEQMKQKNIALKFNLSKSAVSKIIKKYQTHGRRTKETRGRKLKLNAAAVRILKRIVLKAICNHSMYLYLSLEKVIGTKFA